MTYKFEHAHLEEENSRLKGELAKVVVALETEQPTNYANLKGFLDLVKANSSANSLVLAPSQPF